MKPSDFPPPFTLDEAIAPPTDPEDERIEVGVCIVGAGPAGLACAIRLGQLLEDDPATAERLGDVPVAVLEKGKQPGSHLLSGAVVNPRALRRLFRGRKRIDELPLYGRVEAESVYLPLRRVIHTMGWPLRAAAKYREFGGSFVYPMGDDMVTLGMVVGLDHRDAELSVHDLLQELKTHPKIRRILEGGERVAWGAKTIPEGGFLSLPDPLHAPGLLLCGDGAGMVNVPALKGIHYAIESGRFAAEAAFAALQPGMTPWTPGALAGYDEAVRQSFIWRDLETVRNMRQAFGRGFWLGGALAGAMTASRGRFPPGDARTEGGAGPEYTVT